MAGISIVVLALAIPVAVAARSGAPPVGEGGATATGIADDGTVDLALMDDERAAHYRAAARHADTFRAVTCWCGCEQFLAHENLYDCFVRADGQGWEPHAVGCGICLSEAAEVRYQLDAGASPERIASTIDDAYGPTMITVPDEHAGSDP
jgi:hypothetical protein